MSSSTGIAREVRGTGRTILFLHGIGHDRHAWDPIVDRVSADRRMVLVDLPGHGLSPLPSSTVGLGVQRIAGIVHELMAELGIEGAVAVGNSLGGAVALELVRRGSAGACLAISPIGFWSPWEVRYAIAVLRGSRAAAVALKPVLRPLLARSVARRAVMFPFFGRPQVLTPEQAARAALGFVEAPGLTAILPYSTTYVFRRGQIDGARVTIAWGDKDRLLRPRQAERAGRLIPDARVVPLPGCGHVAMFDDPESVANLVLSM